MRLIKALPFLLLLLAVINGVAQTGKTHKLASPDKLTTFEVRTNKGVLMGRMFFAGKAITNWSRLGVQTGKGIIEDSIVINSKSERRNREQFAWPLGEDDVIADNYNEATFVCKSGAVDLILLTRIYNGSVAFRYELPNKDSCINSIKQEYTSFNISSPCSIYQYNHESVFTPVLVDSLRKTCDLPATLTNGKMFLSIGEACNLNYVKTELQHGDTTNALKVSLRQSPLINISGVFISPWRTISVSKTAIGLHAFSQLYLKLNRAPTNGVPAWIKPGKLIRSQLNTRSGLDCIDFAAMHNFQYILFDAGWYGAEFRSGSDPTKVIPEIEMPKVIQYGKEKGIGVILYVNYVGLKAKLDTILPLYKQWGVAGMKFGFVDGLSQDGLTWLSGAIKKVNDAGFILDIHDNYKPTGLSRTYPALLTQEGIRGNENSPDAFHTTVLPFTRLLAGPADYTFCYPGAKNRYTKNLLVSMGQQLALTVVYFSPLQAMFWYGIPTDYTNEEEIEFFKNVPTVWNESHYLAGDIGKGISVARRSGDTWFIGNAAGLADWNATVKLSFLQKHKSYTATVYEDDDTLKTIRKRTITVKRNDMLLISLKGKTGQAILIKPFQ
ncbi:MAG TPA: glycoside hydrolase family 97 catalytic domain-containing protein [Niastella sp.]|nr:glycoside hydrolase family 97 catalytic domain-containing protein [Niastella sp.]